MALINCNECGKETSTTAKACPHCGAKVRKPAGMLGWILAILIVFYVIASTLNNEEREKVTLAQEASKTPAQKAAEALQREENGARGACMLFIKQQLHDPSSADFETSAFTEKKKDGSWTVQRHLRAKNKLGALVLGVYECRVRLSGENWSLLSLKEIR